MAPGALSASKPVYSVSASASIFKFEPPSPETEIEQPEADGKKFAKTGTDIRISHSAGVSDHKLFTASIHAEYSASPISRQHFELLVQRRSRSGALMYSIQYREHLLSGAYDQAP